MKIIILGAGQVGATLAENLASESNDITVVDTDAGDLSEAAAAFAATRRDRRRLQTAAGAHHQRNARDVAARRAGA